MLRLSLAVACLFISVVANCAALTLDDISLMLRSGVPSKVIILEDLTYGKFDGELDAVWEKEFVRLGASPALIEALRSGKPSKVAEIIKATKNGTYEPSEEDKIRRQDFISQLNSDHFTVSPLMSEEKEADQIKKRQLEQARFVSERAAKEAAERRQRASRAATEIAEAKRAAAAAKIAARKEYCEANPVECRKEYCEAHPVECETLEAARSAAGAAEQARSAGEDAKHQVESLKMDLWMQGLNPNP
jgi:hypothetical protein